MNLSYRKDISTAITGLINFSGKGKIIFILF